MTDDTILSEQVDYYRARAGEYDKWWNREGRYDRGSEANAKWFAETFIPGTPNYIEDASQMGYYFTAPGRLKNSLGVAGCINTYDFDLFRCCFGAWLLLALLNRCMLSVINIPCWSNSTPSSKHNWNANMLPRNWSIPLPASWAMQ